MNDSEIVFIDGWTEDQKADHFADLKQKQLQSTYFISACAPSAFHWHYQQSYDCLISGFFLPGISGLLNGIEASLRVTLSEIEGHPLEGDLGAVMSNGLLRHAAEVGMDVQLLSFPEEDGFQENLKTKNVGVEIVRLRNDICHGNFRGFVGNIANAPYFVPECLAPTAAVLLQIAFDWTRSLADLRYTKGLREFDTSNLITPDNPLNAWLTADSSSECI